jgi:hypothetical protein
LKAGQGMARRLDEIQERAGADRHSTRDSFPESLYEQLVRP